MSDLATTRLAELETVIERGQQTFVEVGNALVEIRDQRLYRKTHATFEAYCKERWGWTRRQANRQIDAAKVVETLGPTGPKPATEREARDMLDGLEPEERREVREGKATPATVEHLAEVKVPKTKKTAGDESKEPSPQENLDEVLKDARICAIILRDAVHQICDAPEGATMTVEQDRQLHDDAHVIATAWHLLHDMMRIRAGEAYDENNERDWDPGYRESLWGRFPELGRCLGFAHRADLENDEAADEDGDNGSDSGSHHAED